MARLILRDLTYGISQLYTWVIRYNDPILKEKLTVEEAVEKFPDAKIAILSSDLMGGAAGLRETLRDIVSGHYNLIIGTQLVAKGHNFPLLTLVGVIDADLGLQGSDLRAAERTFQLMRQVAGRSGRADKPGTALMQTYQPERRAPVPALQ